jgi:DNA polymerase-1
MLGKHPLDVTDVERQECKKLTFLIMYGGGAKKLAESLKVSQARAGDLIKQYFAAYPALKRAIDEVHAQVRRDLFVRTPFGFQRRFIKPDNWVSADGFMVQRQAWNTIIQNTAACLMYCAMLRFQELWSRDFDHEFNGGAKWESIPVLQIHDSLVVDAHPDEAQEVARLLQRAMTEAGQVALRYGVAFDVPIDSDVKAGPSWGETKELKESNGKT